jgi:hypothetical protein
MANTLCDVCDYALDKLGRCAKCAGVLNEDVERMKHATILWIICSVHGALEVTREQQYRREWSEPNPKDKRKKNFHHEWLYRCPNCAFNEKATVECFKDVIELPEESYREELRCKMRDWDARKLR